MVITADAARAASTTCRSPLRDHGAQRSAIACATRAAGAFLLSEFNLLGFNYRMTDLQGALGCAQMDRADWILGEHGRRAALYDEALANVPAAAHAHHSRGERPRLPVLLLPVRARGAGLRGQRAPASSGATG